MPDAVELKLVPVIPAIVALSPRIRNRRGGVAVEGGLVGPSGFLDQEIDVGEGWLLRSLGGVTRLGGVFVALQAF